jgi:hypothetical protein
MRITRVLAAAAVAGTLLVPGQAGAATPHPGSCTGVVEGVLVPANPAGLAETAALAVVSGQVECHRDPLTTAPVDLLTPYTGHIDIEVMTASGAFVCDAPFREYDAVGQVLVMEIEHVCVIPVSQPLRTQTLYARLRWATMPPYICCGERRVALSPVGVDS